MHPDIPAGSLLLDEEHFPDRAFRRFLIRYFLEEIVEISGEDSRSVVFLRKEDVDAVDFLSCEGEQIRSLDGIEYFPNLETLDCSDNELTQLDLSRIPALSELYCTDNQLTSLDLSGLEQLRVLYCSRKQLSELDTSSCKELC